MPEIKLQHVISCSSEDSNYPAENLINGDGFKKWKSAKPGEKQISVTFQLEKACKIDQIDIGNDGSAFVEVLVGKSTGGDDNYQVILVASAFASPLDSRAGKNLTTVRMFSADKLSKNVLDQKWDRVKVVCTQPFNKSIQYGLAFITFRSPSEEGSTSTHEQTMKQGKLGGFRLKPEEGDSIRVGSLFSSRDKEKASVTPLSGAAAIRAASRVAEDFQRSRAKDQASHTSKTDNSESRHKQDDSSVAGGSRETASATSEKTVTLKPGVKRQHSLSTGSTKSQSDRGPQPLKKSKSEPTKLRKSVAFNQLMKKVVFVMSGYQNPERSQIRDKAIEMGASYKSDWGKGCTHLICAFENTPKYNQVKGKGRIVNKKWILDSYKSKKLLPWRQYRVGRARSPPDGSTDSDSQDEECLKQNDINTSSPKPATSNSVTKKQEPGMYSNDRKQDSGEDTEDEIRRVRESKQDKTSEQPSSSKAPPTDVGVYDESTDEEMTNDSTHAAANKASDSELPELPDLFRGKKFFFYGHFKPSECRQMRRYIVAYNGVLEDYMTDTVSFVLTKSEWDSDFDKALSENPSLVFIRPQWLYVCDEQQKYVPYQKYAVMPK